MRAVLLAATADDVPFLRDVVLVEAAFPGGTARPADPLADDHIARYIDRWGRRGDLGLVAWDGGARVGAAWMRLMAAERPGYGFVAPEVPELTVAVVADHRGRGWGRALVVGALDLAAAHGTASVSLSVAGTNEVAAALYRSLGFVDVAADAGGSVAMVAHASPPPRPSADEPPVVARLATVADGPALVRLRQVMLGQHDRSWVAPFLRLWPEETTAGRWVATVVDGHGGRPVASALAVVSVAPPAPGRVSGLTAHVGSVATEPGWRRRGRARAASSALVAHLDERGVATSTLTATPDGRGLYRSLGYEVTAGGAPMRRPGPG